MSRRRKPGYDEFLECKGPMRHAWFSVPSDWNPSFGGDPFTLRCERCGCERRDTFDIHGELMTRRYVYPDGYLNQPGEPRLTMPELRLAVFSRYS